MTEDRMTKSGEPRGTSMRARFVLAVLFVGALTGASGLLEGRFGNRWTKPIDLIAAGQTISEVPEHFGDWELQTAGDLDDQSVKMLQCVGSTQRVYRNRKTGQTVGMFLIVGPPGPTSVHTPEICYSSQDYDHVEDRKLLRVRESELPGEAFWEVTMHRKNLQAEVLHVAYAWNAGDGWKAAERPRFAFASQPFLYKLQVAGTAGPGVGVVENDPCRAFLWDFLPALDRILFRPSVGQPSAS